MERMLALFTQKLQHSNIVTNNFTPYRNYYSFQHMKFDNSLNTTKFYFV
jgi:hypothetical protein